ncbi:hypothetical protein XELAEV_18035027mg [Xenopus laevis]|uniref:Uncharacterized protein n=1 Tax=Xenopus laevis TaxID=8355 RepID=A0A974CG03_XENLA|nr:hypothetical protein XELAEV_18035027mg [Xenopus laevis]
MPYINLSHTRQKERPQRRFCTCGINKGLGTATHLSPDLSGHSNVLCIHLFSDSVFPTVLLFDGKGGGEERERRRHNREF